jgi:hypothetical protein
MASWEEEARRVQRENKRELTSLKGHWVIVRKFTIKAQEKLNAMRQLVDVDVKGIPKVKKEGDLAEFIVFVLKNGVLESSLKKTDETPESFQDDEFLTKLLEYAEVADEIYMSVLEFNRPLERKKDESSQTASSGSTEEPDSPQDKPFPTEQTQVKS